MVEHIGGPFFDSFLPAELDSMSHKMVQNWYSNVLYHFKVLYHQ